MPVSGVTAGDTITEAWGDSVAASVGVLEATDSTQNGRLTALEASDAAAYRPGGTDVAIADGGTGSSTAAAARTALGVGTAQTPVFAGVSVPAVVFPAVDVPSANVNTLDDYEEGTWIPTVANATPGTSTFTPTVQVGIYQKIGNRCHFQFTYTATYAPGSGASGNVTLSGLPFPSSSVANSRSTFAIEASGWTKAGVSGLAGSVTANASTITLRFSGSGIAITVMAAADLAAGTVVFAGAGSYPVA